MALLTIVYPVRFLLGFLVKYRTFLLCHSVTDLFKKSFNFDKEGLDLDDLLTDQVRVESLRGVEPGHGRQTGVGGF